MGARRMAPTKLGVFSEAGEIADQGEVQAVGQQAQQLETEGEAFGEVDVELALGPALEHFAGRFFGADQGGDGELELGGQGGGSQAGVENTDAE